MPRGQGARARDASPRAGRSGRRADAEYEEGAARARTRRKRAAGADPLEDEDAATTRSGGARGRAGSHRPLGRGPDSPPPSSSPPLLEEYEAGAVSLDEDDGSHKEEGAEQGPPEANSTKTESQQRRPRGLPESNMTIFEQKRLSCLRSIDHKLDRLLATLLQQRLRSGGDASRRGRRPARQASRSKPG